MMMMILHLFFRKSSRRCRHHANNLGRGVLLFDVATAAFIEADFTLLSEKGRTTLGTFRERGRVPGIRKLPEKS
jgi:hypothetical protein